MVMQLAGKYQDLRQWSGTPEATGGEYPTLRQGLNQQLNVLKTATPGSEEAMQAMIAISEIQNAIKEITAANRKNYSKASPGSDPRDYPLEYNTQGKPVFWASQALPLGVTIDEDIKQGNWRGKT